MHISMLLCVILPHTLYIEIWSLKEVIATYSNITEIFKPA